MRWLPLLFMLPALTQAQQPRPDTVATRVQVRGADCALVPAAAQAGEWLPRHTPRFTPRPAQAAEAEKRLPAAPWQLLCKTSAGCAARQVATIQTHLPQYKRQYLGFYNAQQQPCLFISCFYARFYAAQDAGWLHQLVEVDDGGAGFWRIYYNLATHQFYSFSHNAEG